MKERTTAEFKKGNAVLYIPEHLMREAIAAGNDGGIHIKENLGVVTSVNDTYVFVKYTGDIHPKATRPHNLFFIRNNKKLLIMFRETEKNEKSGVYRTNL